jgi:hypothetical protein
MTNEEKMLDLLEQQGKTLENLQAGQERVEKTQQEQGAAITRLEKGQQEQAAAIARLEDGQKQQGSIINHIATAIKALATKQDVERVEKEVDKIKQKLRPPRAD